MKLHVGLVGLGPKWDTRHRPALAGLSERFRVRAVCDPVAHRAACIAQELGARQVDGFRALVSADDIEAVLILSGRWYGALPMHAACDHGKAIYCGASVEMPQAAADSLCRRVREAGIAFMAELPLRLAPATLRLKELIATRLGEPRMLFCHERHEAKSCTRPHRSTTTNSEAFVSPTRRLIELVDWCRYTAGCEPRSVQCMTHAATLPAGSATSTEDYALINLLFDCPDTAPVMAQIASGGYVPVGWEEAATFRRPADLQVVCQRGIAFVDLPGTITWFDEAGQHTERLSEELPLGERLLMQFHRNVSSLVLRHSSLEDAYQALQIVTAAKRSAQCGRRVDL